MDQNEHSSLNLLMKHYATLQVFILGESLTA